MTVEQKSPIPRRAIAKGIAWSVPAFALATAAPALAQSPLVNITPTGDACKYGGGSQPGVKQAYLFPVFIENISHESVTITTVSGSVAWATGGSDAGNPQFWDAPPHAGGQQIPGQTITLSSGGSGTFYFVVDNVGKSPQSSGTVTLTVRITGVDTGRSYTIPVSADFATTAPCNPNDSTAAAKEAGGEVEPEEPPTQAESEPEGGGEPENAQAPAGAASEESTEPAAIDEAVEPAAGEESAGS